MDTRINETSFGSITIDGNELDHDVIIRLNGKVEKRKKKLSKAIYGTSHTVSLDEVRYLFEKGAEGIVIGTGQYGVLKLSEEARSFLEEKKCSVKLFPTPEAIEIWNDEKGAFIALFHITC